MLQLLEPKQNFFGEEVLIMLSSLEELAWSVLAIVIGNYLYDHFFKN